MMYNFYMTGQHTGEIHCIDANFNIHELQDAAQAMQELPPIVVVSLSLNM